MENRGHSPVVGWACGGTHRRSLEGLVGPKRMNLLIISPLIPFPLIDGGRKGIFYPMKHLAERGHHIHMACLSDVTEASVPLDELKKYCTLDIISNSKKRTVAGVVNGLTNPTPYLLSRFHNEQLLLKAFSLVEQGTDIVMIDGMHCAFYGLEIMQRYDVPVVLRLHNIESMILDRFAGMQTNIVIKTYVLFENRKLRKYEEAYCPAFDRVLTISEPDDADLRARSATVRSVVVHQGVDTEYFTPDERKVERHSVLWMAAFGWIPNRDSFWWFVRDIVPLIVTKVPDVIIYVVGSHAPPEVLAFRHPNIRIIGFVEDVREYVNKSSVAVVPLRIGGGIRIKLFELFAMRKAVVSTSIGCEGLNVEHDRHLVIADDVHGFADAVVSLLRDPERRKTLGSHASTFVRTHHTWEETARKYEAVFEDAVQTHNTISS